MSFSFAGSRAVDPTRQIARTGIQGRGRVKQVFDYPQLAHVWAQQAQEHCSDPETSSRTCTKAAGKARTRRMGPWFDGYERDN